ncbi:thiamine pyrophosphate-dependent enzyme, partial [Roseovarius salis]|uniref:thiamine pyrophosphate-dependent enzyme n=1 Tax=Roseovarius salis TaxID=3376063 RepID=UPI0037CBF363
DTRPVAAAAAIAEALRAASKPLFVFGGGAARGAADWRRIVELAGAASFTTYAGRGVAAGHALDFGAYLARPDSADRVAEADLVVAVGTELSEIDLWRDRLGHSGRFIRVDIDPAELRAEPGTTLAVQSDAAALAEELLNQGELGGATGWQAAEVSAARTRWKAECEAERPGIVAVCDALRAALPADTMVFSDMTQFGYVAKEVWPMDRPGHWHHPFGFGTLGYALPAAIGGAVARRGRPTLAIAGDYGFQYTVQELGAAVELGLPLPILVWDNGKLKEIEDSMVRAQIAPRAVEARNPDFAALARAYGAHAQTPRTVDEVAAAARQALQADAPTLIHVRADIPA